MHDPGGKRVFPLLPGMHGEAFISEDGLRRHWLARVWQAPVRYALWIGANPSTARHDVDDPTVRKEIGFTQRWGLTGYFKGNVSDYRSTNPKVLGDSSVVLASSENLVMLKKLAKRADRVVMAYGALIPRMQPLADEILQELRLMRISLWCLGVTKNGNPRHPLYVRNETQLMEF